MLRKLFTHKLRMELAEVKHEHQLKLNESQAMLERERKHWDEDRQRIVDKLTQEHELKLKEVVTVTKLDSQQQIKKAQLDAEAELNKKVGVLNKEHYDRLADALNKLHTEGNVTTKFTQDLALQMMSHLPANKSETKVLTGSIDVNTDGKK